MILKKLEIAGFKSFGKKVELDFDSPITAIVGPNGSGKSNVSEAIRWVLGEQSMKSLRGKRGEDLIFHGSNNASQLGKARVSITFNNEQQVFPVDFPEVVITREVYRDGANEYRLNDSVVRLKDIVQLMSNVGIGGSGHHIISQGEADRILYASSRDRKNMIEDALGLRIYHLKQQEAERKSKETEENIREVGMLRREIQPHMRFLKEQAAKVEASTEFRNEYVQLLLTYVKCERVAIQKMCLVLEEKEKPLQEMHGSLQREIQELGDHTAYDENFSEKKIIKELEELVQHLDNKERERREKERAIGRIEGQLAIVERRQKIGNGEVVVFSADEVRDEMNQSLTLLERMEQMMSLKEVRSSLGDLKNRIVAFLSRTQTKERDAEEKEEQYALLYQRNILLEEVNRMDGEKQELFKKKLALEEEKRRLQHTYISQQNERQSLQSKLYSAKESLQALEIERERICMRREKLQQYETEMSAFNEQPDDEERAVWDEAERIRAQTSLQRLKIKLEEVGGINPEVLREYEEVRSRDSFLSQELSDLERTAVSLAELTQELKKELVQNFSEGVKKINTEFNTLFQTMFGGGNAKLILVELQIHEEDQLGQLGQKSEGLRSFALAKLKKEYGVEIAVDIPRKRIKNLDMLSGGERALTSIALLFAMSFVNPPPFLVLDETDAALDEANSQRYGAMLRNLSGKTQLMVITHNRQTMKEARVLYGVTMGSDGISRLLSLKFEEATVVSGKQHEA